MYRWISSFLVALMLFTFSFAELTHAAVVGDPPLELDNGIVKMVVDSKGHYTIKTVKGNPLRKSDDDKWLLFQDKSPDTSFTTFRINDEDYIFGEGYGLSLARKAALQGRPEIQGKAIVTTWDVDGVEIKQKLELIIDKDNPNYGNVFIQYGVTNHTQTSVQVGSRILLDVMTGTNDGAGIKLGNLFIDTEKTYTGSDVPKIWRASDNEFAPSVISYGLTSGWGNKTPDAMTIGHWQGLSQSTWEYNVKPDRNFTIESDYGKKDTAVAFYWNPIALPSGERTVFETYYGIGEVPDKAYSYNVQLSSISKLNVNETYDGYKEEEFEITAYVENNLPNSADVYDATASISFEKGLQLVKGEESTKVKRLLKVGEQQAFTWRVRALPQDIYKMEKYRVDVYDSRQIGPDGKVNTSDIYSSSRFVLLPSVDGGPPKTLYNTVSPDKLYYSGKRSFTIKGTGFEMYKDTTKWKLLLQHAGTKQELKIPSNQISVSDDTTILATLEDELPVGEYNILIEQQDSTRTQLPFKLMFTKDKTYISRNYGVLAVLKDYELKGSSSDPTYFYRVLPLKDEDQLEKLKAHLAAMPKNGSAERSVLLTVKGDIREVRTTTGKVSKYLVYSANKKAVINDIMTYSSPVPMIISDNKQQVLNIDPTYNFGFNYALIPAFDPGFPWNFDAIGGALPQGTEVKPDTNADLGLPEFGFDKTFKPVNTGFDIDYPYRSGQSGLNKDQLNQLKNTFVYIQGQGLLGVNAKNGFDFWYDNFNIALQDGQAYTLEGDREEAKDETIVVQMSGVGKFLNVMLSGLPIDINELILANRDDKDMLSFGAKVSLPFLGGKKSADGEEPKGSLSIDAKDILFSRKGYEGLIAEGELSLSNFGMVKGIEANVGVDTFHGHYTVNGSAEIGVVKAEVSFEIMRERQNDTWYLNKLILSGEGDPGIPVVPGSVYVTKLGGGVENLAELTNPYYGGAEIFTVVVLSDISAVKVFKGEFEGKFNRRKMRIDGNLDVASLPIFKTAYLEASWDTGTDESFYVTGGGTIDILDGLIAGGGSVYISDKRLDGRAYIELKIPRSVPFIGGETLAKASAGINNEEIWAAAQINLLLVTIELTADYYWSGGLDVGVGIASSDPAYLPRLERNKGIYAMPVRDGNQRGTMMYGTNMRIIGSSKPMSLLASRDGWTRDNEAPIYGTGTALAADDDKKTHMFTLGDSSSSYLIEMTYEGDLPQVNLTKPDGTPIDLVEKGNYFLRTDEVNGVQKHYMVIGLEKPANGVYTLTSDHEVETKLAQVLPVPKLTNANVELEGSSKLKLSWSGQNYKESANPAEASKLIISLSTEKESVGRVLATVDPKTGEQTLDIPEDLQTGDYYVHFGLSTEKMSYSEQDSQKLHIVNPKAPAAVSSVQGAKNGNGMLRAAWPASSDPATTGYNIEVFDTEGNAVDKFGVAYADAKNTTKDANGNYSVIIGGTYQGLAAEGKPPEILGLETGKTYKIGITPVRQETDIHDSTKRKSYYGPTTISAEVELPKPKPPEFTVGVAGKSTEGVLISDTEAIDSAQGSSSQMTGVKERDVKLMLSAEEEVTADIYVDSVKSSKQMHGQSDELIIYQLTDGIHYVDLVAKNKDGDMAVKREKFVVDTKAPVIMLDSPASDSMAPNGIAEIRGRTEAGARVVIGGREVAGDEQGRFQASIPLSNHFKHDITVSSTDAVGNTTTSQLQVINGAIQPLKKVRLTPGIEKMKAGESVQLQLIGIQNDAAGSEMNIDPQYVKWEFMEGESIAHVDTDGRLTAKQDGDIVLLASYQVTDTYAFQDAVVIKVGQESDVKPVSRVKLTPDIQKMFIGDSLKLDLIGLRDDGTAVTLDDSRVTWEISNGASLASIDQTGTLTALAKGDITVRASNRLSSGSTVQDVMSIHIERDPKTIQLKSVNISPDAAKMIAGESLLLKLTGIDDEGLAMALNPEKVDWKLTKGGELAFIDSSGKLTARQAGSIGIQATYTLDNGTTLQAEKAVTIVEQESSSSGNGAGSGTGTGNPKPVDPNTKGASEYDLTPDTDLLNKRVDEISISIHKGAVNQVDKLLVGRVSNVEKYLSTDEKKNKQPITGIYELGLASKSKQMKQPIEVTFHYDAERVQDSSGLAVYRFNDYMQKWEVVPGKADPLLHEVTVNVDRLGKYALFNVSAPTQFVDISKERWSASGIYALQSLGIIDGLIEGKDMVYQPERSISRAEFIKLLASARKLSIQTGNLESEFKDWHQVPEWAKPYMYTSIIENILGGRQTEQGLVLDSNTPVTRAEAVTILGRVLAGNSQTAAASEPFADASDIPDFAKSYVEQVRQHGLMDGYEDGTFRPGKTMTREETAILIYRLIQFYDR
ncbi:S-layer homology domain-containing protein [Paenibacillus sp. P36]|uniref:S-layer homology domain-containing protein n=1 Tax=Paenibacillus sp. P36 TaxID=3342538 RepID=UPI0038B348E2